jgi:8-oxo-dGTP diphosphatase
MASDAVTPPAPHSPMSTPAVKPRIAVVAAVVWRDGRLLFTQRPPGGPIGLQWEFPGGKIEPGESAAGALRREVREELGVEAEPLEELGRERHDYAHGMRVELVFLRCTLGSWEFKPSAAVHAVQWWRPEEIPLAEVLEADREFLRRLGARS